MAITELSCAKVNMSSEHMFYSENVRGQCELTHQGAAPDRGRSLISTIALCTACVRVQVVTRRT